MTQKQKNSPVLATYRKPDRLAAPMYFVMFVLMGLYVVQLPYLLELASESPIIMIAVVLVVPIILYFLSVMYFIDRMEVREDGIYWWQLGFRTRVAWQDMTGFGMEGGYGRRGTVRLGVIYAYGGSIPLSFYVPVSKAVFEKDPAALHDFMQTPFGQYMQQYAPHLFEKSEKLS